ncbi:hypothetical protein PHYSODRAFT_296374 [Phytophthora sojae]|uniref:Uncharacterized protein n=1 Tax=Phytophthora sojae (strain P6497) TaxID=1094619 RepID=G4YTJ9_PHYSP|nr:hypothetical protein PHYSODRAFT_296374 [Phytophthora sojae]EGZ24227.1 hypothetical protein PHYSODRAFT_296374 [Phytophthora sojae]|eukprot:XP_009519515.1 hypothetical protein PHYSODRAFT_296374 [Phytophthora sojae]
MVMGTDSKITNLVNHSHGSSGSPHQWMSVVPRFPSYRIMLFTPTEMELWPRVSARYPVVDIIVRRSRGRFSRSFIVGAVECFQRDFSIELCDLLDAAFSHVCSDAHKTKMFLKPIGGKVSQLVAISYTNAVGDVEDSTAITSVNTMGVGGPALKKRRVQVKSSGMHKHFANLVDEEVTDVAVSAQQLMIGDVAWEPKCSFASIVDDMLLYLAILGGKTYPSYYDRVSGTYHSTKQIFSIVNPDEYVIHENTQAPTLDFKRYENMVAHAIFSSSRRNGVRGIPFSDFLPCFLGEFEDKIWMKEVLMVVETESDSNGRLIDASNLLEGYDAGGLAERTIPFLAPPNTEWPQPILDTNTDGGCKFGHLIRTVNEERCDVYVQDLAKKEKAMFVCECKYREEKIDVGVVTGILDGLQKRWGEEWKVVVVICTELTNFRAWKRQNIGCVKFKRSKRAGRMIANWVFQPKPKEREKLAIIIQTGVIT